MTDKQPMQAMDDHRDTAAPKANDGIEWPSGKDAGGESNGGAYPNPHSGKEGKSSPSHGGQTDITYHGGGQPDGDGEAPNAATQRE